MPKEWIDKYKGKFDAGWDKISDETFARQKKMGVIPANADQDAAAGRPAGLGQPERRPEEALRAADGGLRRLPVAHRS